MFDINSVQGTAIRNAIANRLDHGGVYCRCVPPITEVTVEKVIFHDPATIVYWSDNTRTVVKCQLGDTFDPKLGFLLAVCKKACGNKGNYNELLKEHVPGYGKKEPEAEHKTKPTVAEMREELTSFCNQHSCLSCPLYPFKCGKGYHFQNPPGNHGYMTDKEIAECYGAMKGAKRNE